MMHVEAWHVHTLTYLFLFSFSIFILQFIINFFKVGQLELSLVQRLYGRSVVIMDADLVGNKRRVDFGSPSSSTSAYLEKDDPIILSYHGQRHYNAIVKHDSNITPASPTEGTYGMLVFSDPSSVQKVITLRPLYIMQRNVDLFTSPQKSLIPVVGQLYTYVSSSSEKDQTSTTDSDSASPAESSSIETPATVLHKRAPVLPAVVVDEDSSMQRQCTTQGSSPRSTPLKLSFRKAKLKQRIFHAEEAIKTQQLKATWKIVATFAMAVVLLQSIFIIYYVVYHPSENSVFQHLQLRIDNLQAAVAAQQENAKVCSSGKNP